MLVGRGMIWYDSYLALTTCDSTCVVIETHGLKGARALRQLEKLEHCRITLANQWAPPFRPRIRKIMSDCQDR